MAFGGDLSGLQTALRGMHGMVSSAAGSIKDSFKDAFKTLATPLSVAGVVESVRSLMEDVKNIKRISESTGLDTGVTQDMLNLGKAAGIASGEIESMMDKFVKQLAPGSDPSEALYEIADRMAQIKDPTERAREAMDAFGKSGAKLIPILMQGRDGVKKLSEEWGKLDEAEMQQLEHADQEIEKAGSRWKVFEGKVLGWLNDNQRNLDKIPTWRKILMGPITGGEGLVRGIFSSPWDGMPDRVTTAPAENAKTQAKGMKDAILAALKEIDDKEQELNEKPQDKLSRITREISAVRSQIEDAIDLKEVEAYGKELLSLEEQRKGLEKEIATEQKTAADKAKESARQQKELSKEILEDQKTISQLRDESAPGAQNRQYGTLQEVANSGFVGLSGSLPIWIQGPLAAEAQRAQFLDARAHRERIFGNKSGAESDEALSQKLKQDLEDQGAIAPTISERLKSLAESGAKSEQHLADLRAQIAVLKKSQE